MEEDLNNPNISSFRPQRRFLPKPPGPPPRPSAAQRKQAARAEARAERMHLAGLTNVATIVMGVVLVGVILMVVLIMMSRH
jgi:hypothetical protein